MCVCLCVYIPLLIVGPGHILHSIAVYLQRWWRNFSPVILLKFTNEFVAALFSVIFVSSKCRHSCVWSISLYVSVLYITVCSKLYVSKRCFKNGTFKSGTFQNGTFQNSSHVTKQCVTKWYSIRKRYMVQTVHY